MKFCSLFALLLSFRAPASLLEQTFLKNLRVAQTADRIKQIRVEYEQLQRDKRICMLQSQQTLVPSACYRWLHMSRSWNLMTAVQAEPLEQKFDEQCRKAVREELHSTDEWLRISQHGLSDECSRLVQRAVEIHRYRVGAEIENDIPP